jgi:hypothetical protein
VTPQIKDDSLVKLRTRNRLTMQCLDRLDKFLHRNICQMSLSADLEDETLPEDVMYACVSFVDHICSVIEVDISSILERLDSFLGRHLLHWFEAMSIVGRSRQMITLLKKTLSLGQVSIPLRLKTSGLPRGTKGLAEDRTTELKPKRPNPKHMTVSKRGKCATLKFSPILLSM